MHKQAIRSLYLARRRALLPEQVNSHTASITRLFGEYATSAISYLFSYKPMANANEFDVAGCEVLLKKRCPDVATAYPQINSVSFHMEACLTAAGTAFVPNVYGILEPQGAAAIDPMLIDLIFVPLIAFDQQGFRVGYGKGYYDRFITRCRKDVVRVGFSYFEPLPAISDISHFDVPLSYCITPSRIYEF